MMGNNFSFFLSFSLLTWATRERSNASSRLERLDQIGRRGQDTQSGRMKRDRGDRKEEVRKKRDGMGKQF